MDKLLAAIKKAKEGAKFDKDDQYFYYPDRDAAGNGSATIRFLPGKDDDEIPFVKLFTHGFKNAGTNKWLIENCPTSVEQDCPICCTNSELYSKMSKDEARKYGMNRKTSYISRILVVEDKKNPDNEGKVFMFKFGSKIFDKIADSLNPEFDDKEAIDVFDLKKGANFKLRIRIYEGNTNYDKSEFDSPSPCKAKIEYTDENDIQQFIAADKFKSPENLQKRLDLVLGNVTRVAPVKEVEQEQPKESVRKEVKKPSNDDEDDDILKMMAKLAEDDDGDIPF